MGELQCKNDHVQSPAASRVGGKEGGRMATWHEGGGGTTEGCEGS